MLSAHAREGGGAAIEQDEDLGPLLKETQVATDSIQHYRMTRTARVTWMTWMTRMTRTIMKTRTRLSKLS